MRRRRVFQPLTESERAERLALDLDDVEVDRLSSAERARLHGALTLLKARATEVIDDLSQRRAAR